VVSGWACLAMLAALEYHYPQEPFPYQWLIDENGRRFPGPTGV
jgi:hypothetical protein